MLLIIATLFAAVFWLPSPLGWILFCLAIVFEVAQTAVALRWSRRGPPHVGAQTLIGCSAVVVRACRPDGQVKVKGELWQATCPSGAGPGTVGEVTGLEGLTLSVRPRATV